MDAPTPSTELERTNVATLLQRVHDSIYAAIPEFGSSLPNLVFGDVRQRLKTMTEAFLEEVRTVKAIDNFKVGAIRRQLFKDVYRMADARATALKVFWRRRKTKERLYWVEGEELTEDQYAEFGHLLELNLWGMNDDLTGCVLLRKPSGHIMDIFITPVQPVSVITLNLEVSHG
jgi:hypothetical protein